MLTDGEWPSNCWLLKDWVPWTLLLLTVERCLGLFIRNREEWVGERQTELQTSVRSQLPSDGRTINLITAHICATRRPIFPLNSDGSDGRFMETRAYLLQKLFSGYQAARFNPIHAACEQAQWRANQAPSISYWTRPLEVLVSIASHVLLWARGPPMRVARSSGLTGRTTQTNAVHKHDTYTYIRGCG
jgi:hypothetical protein